jgi:amino acid adenylation domain-containing protein
MKHVAVQQLFSQVAQEFRTVVAIEGGHRRISYGELEARAGRLARALSGSGIAKGEIVAILARDVIEVVTAILGVLKAGGVFCPMDPEFPEKRLRSMVEEVGPQWYAIESKFSAKCKSLAANGREAAKVVYLDDGAAEATGASGLAVKEEGVWCESGNDKRESDPNDMCSIYFTSGSTGRPKAIAGRLSGIDHFVRWEIQALGVRPGTRVSQLASPSFDGFLKDVFVPLCAAGVVCVPPCREIILDPRRLIGWIEEQQIEILQCVPSVFRSILNDGLDSGLFPRLRHVVLAGEPLLPADVKRWMAVFGERIQLVNLYGPTETTVTKLFYFVKAADIDRRTIPIGKPMEGAAALIVDEKVRPCATGVAGEIYIRTPHCALGYYGQPELTKEVFIQNPFSDDPNDIVYKTGDYGRVLEDGNFEFLGRKDQQVKIRGVRVELGEIESILCRNEMVKEAAVIDQEDINGNTYLCAYVVLTRRSEQEKLKEYLASYLPEYMVPSAFVEMTDLPRTLNGKVDRHVLSRSNLARLESATQVIAPRTPVEEILAGIWTQVLGLKQVGIHDNFFERGGHSLLAIQVISRVRDAFQVELPLRSLFEAPTVAKFATKLEAEIHAGADLRTPAVRPVARDAARPFHEHTAPPDK